MLQQIIYQESFAQSALTDVDLQYLEFLHEGIENASRHENDIRPLWLVPGTLRRSSRGSAANKHTTGAHVR